LWRRVDVALEVADEERRPVEDADRVRRHGAQYRRSAAALQSLRGRARDQRAVERASVTVPPVETAAELDLVAALRAGDEAAFMELVDRYGASMLRLAMMYVRNRAVAEEVVQDAWVGVLRGIDSFQGRSSLKTWIFRILTNTAKTRAQREGRTIPFAALGGADDDAAVDADRFLPWDHARAPRHWALPPSDWAGVPEDKLVGKETLGVIARASDALP